MSALPVKGKEPASTAMPTTVKDEARRLVEALPDDATWDDVMYRLHVRQSIERGLADSNAGRTVSQDDVRALLRDRFGIGTTDR